MLTKKINGITKSLMTICERDCPDFLSIIRTEITDIPRVKIKGIDNARMMFSFKLLDLKYKIQSTFDEFS